MCRKRENLFFSTYLLLALARTNHCRASSLPFAHVNLLCVMTRTLKSPPMVQTTGLDPRFKLLHVGYAFVRLPLGICIREGKGEGSFDLLSIVSANPFRPSLPHSFIQILIYDEQRAGLLSRHPYP